MQPLTQAGAATEPGFALKIAEARKMAAHNADCRGIGVTFLPIVVETLGGWSPDSISQIARIGRLAGQRLVLFLPLLSSICSSAFLSSSGKGMPPCGLAAYPFTQPGWMGASNSYVCVFVCVCVYFLCANFICVLYYTVLFYTVFYCILLYSIVFYCILLYSTVFYCILLYSTVFYCTS